MTAYNISQEDTNAHLISGLHLAFNMETLGFIYLVLIWTPVHAQHIHIFFKG